ncbi:MAG TPA: IPT/TIG domain-containing protein [Povalibacter sp.]|nr:IPT/TIG domain-containing protein [Povalibacter sp.]
MHHFHGARRIAGVALLLSLCACSSGGGDDSKEARQIELSTQSVSFAAESPNAAAPDPQVVTATFSPGLANLAVIFNGQGVESVTTDVSGNSARITITPSAPPSLGGGIFSSTVGVTGYFCADASCSRLEAGGSKTLTVTYQVSPTATTIAPNVAVSGVSDAAILRGAGFSGFTVQGVKFGDIAATETTVVSDNEIRVTYPALPAGSYPVTVEVQNLAGSVPSTATLIAVDPVSYPAQTLAWPATVTTVRSLIYDAQRSALLVATDSGGGSIVRYPYVNGAWGTPATVSIANLRDMALSTDGSKLLAITTTQLVPVNPETLATDAAVNAPSLASGDTLKSIASINLNSAIITTTAGNATSRLYAYAVATNELTQLTSSLISATARASANGAAAILIQGDPATTATQVVYALAASSTNILSTGIGLNQNDIAPVLDRNATRMILNGTLVYSYTTLAGFGKLPSTTLAVTTRPDGARAYTYDSADGKILTFDISATKSGDDYTPVGTAVTPVGAPGNGVKMIASPDGNVLFLAGSSQIVIQPTPAS